MWEKFNGRGFELIVDALKGNGQRGVEFFPENSGRPFYAKSSVRLDLRETLTLASEVPAGIRVIWRLSADHPMAGNYGVMTYADPIIGEATIPFGDRIPDEVIQSLRKEGGGLRLKVRLSNDGPYFGWDVSMRESHQVDGTDMQGNPTRYWEEYRMAGGDFREAKIFNGKVVRPGWYIDKKTGQRIETDF